MFSLYLVTDIRQSHLVRGLQAAGHDLHTDTVSHYGLLLTTRAVILVGAMGCGATVLSEIIYY